MPRRQPIFLLRSDAHVLRDDEGINPGGIFSDFAEKIHVNPAPDCSCVPASAHDAEPGQHFDTPRARDDS